MRRHVNKTSQPAKLAICHVIDAASAAMTAQCDPCTMSSTVPPCHATSKQQAHKLNVTHVPRQYGTSSATPAIAA